MYFLDTNTCIYFLNGSSPNIMHKILSLSPAQIAIPAIVKAELVFGAYKSKQRQGNLAKVERFVQPFAVLAFEDAMCHTYADIRQQLESTGHIIGPNDLLIAAITRFYNAVLVTHNQQEFAHVQGLKLEDWR